MIQNKHRFACFTVIASWIMPLSALADSTDEPWDVMHPPGPSKEVRIDVHEGTWMGVDVSPDGRTVVFELLGDIYLIPFEGGKAESIASGHAWEMQPRFSPDGSEIAFTSDRGGADNIWVMDSDGSNKRQVTNEDFRLLSNATWTPDGEFIAARKHFTTARSTGTGEIWLYHKNGGDGTVLIERPGVDHQKDQNDAAFSPDGRYLYFSKDTTPGSRFLYAPDSIGQIFEIMRYDTHSGTFEPIVSGAGGAARPTPSPDGRYLAFTRRVLTKTHLYVKDLQTGDERTVYPELDPDLQDIWSIYGVYPHMAWTPDSESIVFWAGGKIRRLNVATLTADVIPFHVNDTRTVYDPPRRSVEVAPDTFDTKMVRFSTVSPAGDMVVFESLGRLYTKKLPNGSPRTLTSDANDHFELFPSWSRDGKWIVFSTWDDEELGTVRKVRASGGRSTQLSTDPGHFVHPRFSPDGKTVVVSRLRPGNLTAPERAIDPGVYSISASGGALTLITRDGKNAQFGLSNKRLFVTRAADSGRKLVSINLQGEAVREHAHSEHATVFSVSPDEKLLAFREFHNIYATPLTATGKAVKVGPTENALPLVRTSGAGGDYPHWTNESLRWSSGPMLLGISNRQIGIGMSGGELTTTTAEVSLSQSVAAEKPSGRVALIGARIVTMSDDAGGIIESGTVLINGNRIEAIGASGAVSIPDDARSVDVTGKTIIPGLIDVHAHSPHGENDVIPEQNWESHALLALGVTTIHDPSNRPSHIFAASEFQRAGLILAPRTFSTGSVIYGARSDGHAVVNSYEDAYSHVQRLRAQGAISVKNYNQPRREQRQQIIRAGHELDTFVVAEGGAIFHLDMTYIADGATGVEHNPPPRYLYEDVLQFWAGSKVGYTPTLNVTFGGQRGEDWWYQSSNVWEHPLLSKYVPPHILQPRSVRRYLSPLENHGHVDSARNAKALADRGVSVHTGAHGQREGLGTHWDMWTYVMGGMSTIESLRAATIQPARYLGFDADIGSIEIGKLADLVIIDGDPVADINDSDLISSVMLNGRLYDAATLSETVTGDWITRPYYWKN